MNTEKERKGLSEVKFKYQLQKSIVYLKNLIAKIYFVMLKFN